METQIVELILPVSLYGPLKAAGSVQERINIATREYIQAQKVPLKRENLAARLEFGDGSHTLQWSCPSDISSRIPDIQGQGRSHVVAALKDYVRRNGLKVAPPAEESVRFDPAEFSQTLRITLGRQLLRRFRRLAGTEADNLIAAIVAYNMPLRERLEIDGRLDQDDLPHKNFSIDLPLNVMDRLPNDRYRRQIFIRAAMRNYCIESLSR